MARVVDVVPSDAAIECPDFSATDYMNSLFPTAQALEGLSYN